MKKNNMDQQELFIRCDCGSLEHQVVLWFDPNDDPDFNLIFVQIHLAQSDSFFRRLWYAVRFIFGYHCRFGCWDEMLIGPEKARELMAFIEEYLSSIAEDEERERR